MLPSRVPQMSTPAETGTVRSRYSNAENVGRTVRLFLRLTKPRVISLIVFTAVIGMFLAAPGLPPLAALVFGTLGIALSAGAAAAINCLVEQKLDAVMARTRARPLPMGGIDLRADADLR